MPVFMTHAEHGATHVNSGEVEAHEKIGWKIDTYENWMKPKRKPAVTAEKESEDAPVIRNKPGRKAKAQ